MQAMQDLADFLTVQETRLWKLQKLMKKLSKMLADIFSCYSMVIQLNKKNFPIFGVVPRVKL